MTLLRLLPLLTFAGQLVHGDRGRREVALTFDACMTPAMSRALAPGGQRLDEALIAELRRTRTPATLFLSGLWVERHPAQARALAADPLFEIGLHGYAHGAYAPRCFHLPALSPAEQAEDLRRGEAALLRVGVRPRWFRFPGGCATAAARALVRARGLQPVAWDVYGGDGKNPDPRRIEAALRRGLRPGSIVLLHMNGPPQAPATGAALPAVLRWLRTAGYTPRPLSRLVDRPPADPR